MQPQKLHSVALSIGTSEQPLRHAICNLAHFPLLSTSLFILFIVVSHNFKRSVFSNFLEAIFPTIMSDAIKKDEAAMSKAELAKKQRDRDARRSAPAGKSLEFYLLIFISSFCSLQCYTI